MEEKKIKHQERGDRSPTHKDEMMVEMERREGEPEARQEFHEKRPLDEKTHEFKEEAKIKLD